MLITQQKWDWQINATNSNEGLSASTLIYYRHLLFSLVRRNLLLNFQQTLLGPVWLLIQPILTLIVYVVVFGKLIGITTDNHLPPVLFYFSGIVLWNFFNDSFTSTSRVFRENIHLFSKVYFPRIILPISLIATNFVRFLIQLAFLFLLIIYFVFVEDFKYSISHTVFYFPIAILSVGLISLSMGLLFSVLTAKYRDIANLVDVCIRLLFFITPVLYPLSAIREDLRWIVAINPLTPLFELFRLGLLGAGEVSPTHLLYTCLFVIVSFIGSVILFHRQGNKLIDVV